MIKRPRLAWMDLLWLAFLGVLAALDPILEIHKQLTLLAIGIFQIFERRFLEWFPKRGRASSVITKIILATLLVWHTGGILGGSYYLIYFVPVVTAAVYFEVWAMLGWTLLTCVAYASFIIPALKDYELTSEGITEMALRCGFFFLAALVVNGFATENRRQASRYRELAETLAETNRQLEQAQEEAQRSERLAALGQLTAGLAHELRNPLAVIKGSAETLMRKLAAADPVTTEVAGYISSEVNRMNMLVTRFLDFARPHTLELAPAQIPPLIDHALKAAHDRWPEVDVEVERHFAGELPQIPVDRDLIEQVFTNLVLNAYEAMGPAGGKLTVSVNPSDSDSKPGVDITFEDTGPGIPPDQREQIFNPFFTTKETGVGLGLSIVSKIVDDHRGWIRVSGEPGKGACFRIFLPEADSLESGE